MSEVDRRSSAPRNRGNLLRLMIVWLASLATLASVAIRHAPISTYVYLPPAIIVAIGGVYLARRRKASRSRQQESERSGRRRILAGAPYIAFVILLVGVVLVAVSNSWMPAAAAALLITGFVIGVSPDYLGHANEPTS